MNTVSLADERLTRWRQRPDLKVLTPEDAVPFIDEMGICTLYPASTEVPNILHAYVGDPLYKGVAEWDSPSGQIYPWRWLLGAKKNAYYGVLVGKKPTYIAWKLLPAVLGAFKERRHPEELFALGELTEGAMRVAQVLEEAEKPMGTDALRKAAGFPIGKAFRAAYVKSLEELELRMLVAKCFEGDEEMLHALVDFEYRDAVEESHRIDADEALIQVVEAVLPAWRFVEAKPLAKAFRIPEPRLLEALQKAKGVREGDLDGKRVFISEEK